MDLTDKLLDNLPGGDRQDEQAVIICLQFPIGKFENKRALDAIYDLDAIIREIIETSGVGMYDGYKLYEGPDEESVKFFIHGKNANHIYHEIKPILQALPSLQELYVIKRFSQFDDRLHIGS
jgi:hypothetical protein